MVKGVTALACASLLTAALVAAPADAGKDLFAVKVAKHKDGPYKSEINSSFEAGQTRTFWWRARSLDTEPRGLVLDDFSTSDGNGYTTRWFKGGQNVSSEVEGDGKEFTLDPGQSRYFSSKQTAPSPSVENCLIGRLSDGFVSALALVYINGSPCDS